MDWLDLGARLEDLAALRKLVQPGALCVEVGSYVGRTALVMLEAGASAVHCVDTWQGGSDERDTTSRLYATFGERVFKVFCENTKADLCRRIFPHRGPSLLYASVWPFPVDLVYLDAGHDYESIREDIRAWWPHVAPGGVLAGHDYDSFWPGVIRAVEESGAFEVDHAVWFRRK